MNTPILRVGISTSLVFGSTLALCLSAVACSSSSDGASPGGSGGQNGDTGGTNGTGGSKSSTAGAVGGGGAPAGGSVGSGGAAAGGSPGAGGTGPGTGGNGHAGSAGDLDSCVPENLALPSNVPAIIQAPSGTTLIHHFHALGTQNYRCTATALAGDAGTTYTWVFIAPEADLSDDCGARVGTHYAGSGGAATPRWQVTRDGSFVQGVKVQASPVAGSIPQLLLAATETTPGAFADVTYVQRLETAGGAAPGAAGCTSANVGEVRKSGYSAEYYFYAGGPDGGAH